MEIKGYDNTNPDRAEFYGIPVVRRLCDTYVNTCGWSDDVKDAAIVAVLDFEDPNRRTKAYGLAYLVNPVSNVCKYRIIGNVRPTFVD